MANKKGDCPPKKTSSVGYNILFVVITVYQEIRRKLCGYGATESTEERCLVPQMGQENIKQRSNPTPFFNPNAAVVVICT